MDTAPVSVPTTTSRPQSHRKVATAAALASAVEWYDYFVFGIAAALVLGDLYFPAGSSSAGVLAAFATFAVGFLARPLGGVVAGHLGDKRGRKPMLVLALTLMGLATHKAPAPEDNWAIIYYPPTPRAVLEVVDPNEPTKVVPYGATGRVRLTTLTKETFVPRFLERDECEREAPCDQYPWDGVRNVRPFTKLGSNVVVGVY